MAQIGYAAMLEQFHPTELVALCEAAETAGFSGVMAADHVQPWVPAQGQAAFVWSFMTAARRFASTRRSSRRLRRPWRRCIQIGSGWALARARR